MQVSDYYQWKHNGKKTEKPPKEFSITGTKPFELWQIPKYLLVS